MGYIEITKQYAELLQIEESLFKNICTKYGILADAYAGVSDIKVIEDNKVLYEALLSQTMIDYMLYLNASGSLAKELSSNTNMQLLFNRNSELYIEKIAEGLKQKGWNIGISHGTVQDLKAKLAFFNIPEANELDEDELDFIEPTNEDFELFDDEELDPNSDTGEIFDEDDEIDEELEAELEENTAKLFAPIDSEEYDVGNGASDESEEDEIILTERPVKFDPELLKAEIAEAAATGQIGEDTWKEEQDLPEWEKDDYGDSEGLEELPSEVDSAITSIMQRIEGVMRSCFELDRPYGVISEKGLIKYQSENGRNKLVNPKPQGGNSEMEIIFKIICQASNIRLKSAPDCRYTPNYKNITGKSGKEGTEKFDYYPAQMLKYALGFVDGNRYKNWKSFDEALRISLKNRLNALYKREDSEGVSEYYKFREQFIKIFTNCLLVIAYSPAGMTIRAGLIGMSKDIENNLKNLISRVSTMSNASVTVYPVKGYRDVVDIQIMYDVESAMSKPSWAYKALKTKLDNGEAPSLLDGLPIGRKLNGEIVEFKLDTSARFMTFVAAGSGSGKGVLTLSMVAAALGSGIPLFYVDYKPDMAPIFWEMEKRLGRKIFAFDANVKSHKNSEDTGFILGASIPDKLKPILKEYAPALLYLRALALMCAIADYRNTHKIKDSGIMFIFDEIQAMQRLICNAVNKVQELYINNTPDKNDSGDKEIFTYCEKLLNWMNSVNTALDKYTVTTGRNGAVYSMFIGQNATAELWNSIIPKIKLGKTSAQPKPFLAMLLKCGTVTKIMGKGTSGSQYGLAGANISQEENLYITKHRFFAMYDGPNASKADVQAFKPFLTLNYDDIFTKCWTNGVGRMYGYKEGNPNDSKEEVIRKNQTYIENMKKAFPAEGNMSNEYGVHPGVGLMGLASMYCNGDIDKLKTSFGKSYEFVQEFFRLSGLDKRYASPEAYMYDMTEDSWLLQEQMINYTIEESSNDQEDYTIDLGPSDEADDSEIFEDENDSTKVENDSATNAFEDAEITGSSEAQPRARESKISDEQVKEWIRQFESGGQLDSEDDIPIPTMPFSEKSSTGNEQFQSSTSFESSYGKSDGFLQEQARPLVLEPREQESFTPSGRTGRNIFITPNETVQLLGLNTDNSIVVEMPEYKAEERFSRKLFSSMFGTEHEFKSRWKAVLNGVANTIKPSFITRVRIYEDAIVFNKKLISTINILGGMEDVRIEDIVNFTMLSKKFRGIRELQLDNIIFERAQSEFGDVYTGLFKVFKSLNKLIVDSRGASGKIVTITRKEVLEGKIGDKAQDESERANIKSKIDMAIVAKNPNLSEVSPGTRSKSWAVARKLGGAAGSAVMNSMKSDNPKLFSATMFGTGALVILGVGMVIGGIEKVGRMIFRRR